MKKQIKTHTEANDLVIQEVLIGLPCGIREGERFIGEFFRKLQRVLSRPVRCVRLNLFLTGYGTAAKCRISCKSIPGTGSAEAVPAIC